MSDRIGVMYAGRIVAVLDGRTADKNEVGLLMATGGAERAAAVPVEAAS
jgi:simple sugar transport system ATP-binding protein